MKFLLGAKDWDNDKRGRGLTHEVQGMFEERWSARQVDMSNGESQKDRPIPQVPGEFLVQLFMPMKVLPAESEEGFQASD